MIETKTTCVILVEELDEEYRYVPRDIIPAIGKEVTVIINDDTFVGIVIRHIISGDKFYQEQGTV